MATIAASTASRKQFEVDATLLEAIVSDLFDIALRLPASKNGLGRHSAERD
jgi:hypothetical protein